MFKVIHKLGTSKHKKNHDIECRLTLAKDYVPPKLCCYASSHPLSLESSFVYPINVMPISIFIPPDNYFTSNVIYIYISI